MKGLYIFSWMKPAVEDLDFERDAKDLHIKKRLIDLTLTGTGILKGILNKIDVYVDNPLQFEEVKVKTGGAYIQGEKIEIGSEQTVQLDDVETEANIIWLKYKLGDSTDPQAVRGHPITGVPYIVWKIDSYELGATKESLFTQTDDIMRLKRVAKVGSELVVTHDYRTWLKIAGDLWANYVNESEFYVGGPEGTGTKLLKQQPAPPIPHHLDLSTGWDDIYRKTGAAAGLVGSRPSYIKAEFGDKGVGTASGETFTKTSNRVGDYDVDEWQGQYLTCADENSWQVLSNTVNTLTLESNAVPVNGAFHLGPNAAGYKFLIATLDAITEEVIAIAEAETQSSASPVKMEFIWHSLTADVKYSIQVASKGGWHQDEWSDFCTIEEIIAGGPKDIPDVCADVLDGEPTIEAADDGIRISWSVKSEYVDKVAGFEICWTDDGITTPDFNNKNHRKVFTDRNYVVLPARISSETATITVKAKMRCVDKAGRHCVTPKTLTDTNAKKYPADLSILVTDRKNIITPGGFGTLKDFLSHSIDINTGRGKMVSEMESEMSDFRGTFASAGKRMDAIMSQAIDWGFVRIVAKSGGFSSIQAAVDSVATSDFHLMLIMPDGGESYSESVAIPTNKVIGFLGFGEVQINGRIYSDGGYCPYLGNLRIINGTQDVIPLDIYVERYQYASIIENLQVVQSNDTSGDAAKIQMGNNAGIPKLIIRNSIFKSANGKGCILNPKVLAPIVMHKAEVSNCAFDSHDACLHFDVGGGDIVVRMWDTMLKVGAGSSYSVIESGAGNKNLYMADCRYNKLPDEANITVDYGTIEAGKVSNVKFDDADLEVII